MTGRLRDVITAECTSQLDHRFPNLFRIGASALLVDIERQLFHHVSGRYASTHEFAMS